MPIRSEAEVRKVLSEGRYSSFLQDKYPKHVKAEDKAYWNPHTGSCGFHTRFTYEALGVKEKKEYTLVNEKDVEKLVEMLDDGEVLSFLHDYKKGDIFTHLPKDNRYGNHMFVLVKGGDKYFLSQGFLHRYKHSLTTLRKEQLLQMLTDLLTSLSDYENKKVWGDLNRDLYKKYFKTELTIFPNRPLPLQRKVHGIVLLVETTQPIKDHQ